MPLVSKSPHCDLSIKQPFLMDKMTDSVLWPPRVIPGRFRNEYRTHYKAPCKRPVYITLLQV